jgi:hypothetical protein
MHNSKKLKIEEEKYVPEKDYGKRTKDWEFQKEERDLIKKVESLGYKISYQDKYVKGQRTRGPKNISRENIKLMAHAMEIQKPGTTILLWRG